MIPAALMSPATGAAALGVALAAGWAWLHWSYKPAIRAEYAAEIAAATDAALAQHQAIALTIVEAAQADQVAREKRRVEIRERIVRVPVTAACADSPAVRAALDGMRARPTGAGARPGAAVPAGVPGGTVAPGARGG